MNESETTLPGLTGNIAALELGSPGGAPIVAIHGWLDNAASFVPLSRRMEAYRWIALDMPGHGKSDPRPPGCIYHFTDYVADLVHVVDYLGFEKCTFVAHSMGAGIAAMFAAAFPEKVDRLVLIDGIGPVSGEDDESLARFRKSMAFLSDGPGATERDYRSWEGLVRRRMEAGTIARESVETLLERGAYREGEKIIVRSDTRLKQHSPIYMSQGKVVAILSGISAPAKLILAEQGVVVSRPSTRERIAAVGDLEVVTVPGHHHVHLDDPGVVAREISEFLERGSGAAV